MARGLAEEVRDENPVIANAIHRHSGMVRKHQTSDVQCTSGNLENPGSMLRIAPGV
jgi:hypothetical protein